MIFVSLLFSTDPVCRSSGSHLAEVDAKKHFYPCLEYRGARRISPHHGIQSKSVVLKHGMPVCHHETGCHGKSRLVSLTLSTPTAVSVDQHCKGLMHTKTGSQQKHAYK